MLETAMAINAEQRWRKIYDQAFAGQSRARRGVKANHEYLSEGCMTYLVVPFTSGVRGLPIRVLHHQLGAYECNGPLVDLSRFHSVELFVASLTFEWTMVYTHEDFAIGGPFFHRRDWI